MPLLDTNFNIRTLDSDILQPINDDRIGTPSDDDDEDAFPQAVAVLSSPSDSGFDVTFRVSSGEEPACIQVLVGIVSNAGLSDNVFSLQHGYFLIFEDSDLAKAIELHDWCLREPFGTLGDYFSAMESKSETPRALNKNLENNGSIRLVYRSTPEPVISFGIGDDPPVEVQYGSSIVPERYKPCVFICGYSNQTVQIISVRPLGTKRSRAQRLEDNNFANLWRARRFPDAVVRCNEESFPVHRAVLCAKSGVFMSLFEGKGTEGSTATVDLSGEDGAAVASLLEHIYTNEMPEHANAIALLPLADRYEVFDCVDDCAEALESLAMKRPAESLRALRPYAEDKRLCRAWNRVCAVILAHKELAISVFRNP